MSWLDFLPSIYFNLADKLKVLCSVTVEWIFLIHCCFIHFQFASSNCTVFFFFFGNHDFSIGESRQINNGANKESIWQPSTPIPIPGTLYSAPGVIILKIFFRISAPELMRIAWMTSWPRQSFPWSATSEPPSPSLLLPSLYSHCSISGKSCHYNWECGKRVIKRESTVDLNSFPFWKQSSTYLYFNLNTHSVWWKLGTKWLMPSSWPLTT